MSAASSSPIEPAALHAIAAAEIEGAYAPYSSFPVAAALVAADGAIVTAVNVENASLGLSMCAERAAVFRAVAEGRRRFVAIALAGSAWRLAPCGACRQVLRELAEPGMTVTFPWDGALRTVTLDELLPQPFALAPELGD